MPNKFGRVSLLDIGDGVAYVYVIEGESFPLASTPSVYPLCVNQHNKNKCYCDLVLWKRGINKNSSVAQQLSFMSSWDRKELSDVLHLEKPNHRFECTYWFKWSPYLFVVVIFVFYMVFQCFNCFCIVSYLAYIWIYTNFVPVYRSLQTCGSPLPVYKYFILNIVLMLVITFYCFVLFLFCIKLSLS